MTNDGSPDPSSPGGGRISDREQADANMADRIARNDADREQSDADAALAGERNISDREQSDADTASIKGAIDTLTAQSYNVSRGQGQLARSNTELAKAMVEYQERAATATRRFRLSMLAIALVFVVLYWRQSAVGQQIADCVQTSGQCFKDQQQRTGDAVSSLNQVSELAAACAADPAVGRLPITARIAAIDKCIRGHLPK